MKKTAVDNQRVFAAVPIVFELLHLNSVIFVQVFDFSSTLVNEYILEFTSAL